MDGREFARLIKIETIDVAVQSTLAHINSPQCLGDPPESADPRQKRAMEMMNAGAREWQLQNEWYRSLDQAQRRTFIGLLRECAKHSALSFCSLLDGTIDPDTIGGPGDPDPDTRRFKISTTGENCWEIIVNLGKSDKLGYLLYEIYVEEHGL